MKTGRGDVWRSCTVCFYVCNMYVWYVRMYVCFYMCILYTHIMFVFLHYMVPLQCFAKMLHSLPRDSCLSALRRTSSFEGGKCSKGCWVSHSCLGSHARCATPQVNLLFLLHALGTMQHHGFSVELDHLPGIDCLISPPSWLILWFCVSFWPCSICTFH